MRIEIRSIADKGHYQKERLVLRIMADTDIGDYLVIQTGFVHGGVSVETYHSYWFPYKSVSTGDLVVLYTKTGQENEKRLGSGKTAHFFYWGLEEAIWKFSDRASVVLHAPIWESKDPDEL